MVVINIFLLSFVFGHLSLDIALKVFSPMQVFLNVAEFIFLSFYGFYI